MLATEGIIVGGHFGVMRLSGFLGLHLRLHLCGLLDALIEQYLLLEDIVNHAFPAIS
jgi:hypothetical protein